MSKKKKKILPMKHSSFTLFLGEETWSNFIQTLLKSL